jgi:hypothetical protein
MPRDRGAPLHATPETETMHDDLLGWTAAALMVTTFACREARAMRIVAVAANGAFIAYGWSAGLLPVLALHLLLLPINLWRWAQLSGMDEPTLRAQLRRGAGWLAVVLLPPLAGCGGGSEPPPEPEGPSIELVQMDRK